MARHKSAMKQARHSQFRKEINRSNRSSIRTIVKKTRALAEQGNNEAVGSALPELYSKLDRMSRRGLVHKNTAARLKSRITRQTAASKSNS